MNARTLMILAIHAFAGWGLCTATMGIGMALAPIQTALVIHAIGAPLFFLGVSWVYFRQFNCTTPLQTATVFVAFVIAMDFAVVALMILHSLDMFASLLGTWIPFALIFASTYLTGMLTTRAIHVSGRA